MRTRERWTSHRCGATKSPKHQRRWGPSSTLASAVDASVPTPGLPLTFTRVYGESIDSRYRLGSLGRGWSDNWDIRAVEIGERRRDDLWPAGRHPHVRKRRKRRLSACLGDTGRLEVVNGAFRLTEADQTVWQFRSDGLLDSVADPNGNKITLGYTNGLLTSLTHSSGQQLLIDYDQNGRIAHVTNPLGPGTADDLVTTYTYDASGEHLMSVTLPGNRTTSYTYATGQGLQREHALLSTTGPSGLQTLFGYDDRGRLSSDLGDRRCGADHARLRSDGWIDATDATGRTTSFLYGLGGQLIRARDGDGHEIQLGYDGNFRLTGLVGPGGETYGYAYDAMGNVKTIQDPYHQATTFAYDAKFNELSSFTDARGNGIEYGYDAQGNLTSITYADDSHETYTYDAAATCSTATNRRGQTSPTPTTPPAR